MKKDGSIRDENPDRRYNRYHNTLIPGIECDHSHQFERVWNGCLIRFVNIFAQQFVCLEDIRDAKGPHCHDSAEKKNRITRINGTSRYVNITDFHTHKYYPQVHKRAEGKAWFDWVASDFEGSPVVRTGIKRFWKKGVKKPLINTGTHTAELFTIITTALQEDNTPSINKKLAELLMKVIGSMECGGDTELNQEIADTLSVTFTPSSKKSTTHMSAQEFAFTIGIWGEFNSMYAKKGTLKGLFWRQLGNLLKKQTKLAGGVIIKVPVSKAKLDDWKYTNNEINAYPIDVLTDVFTMEFKNAGDLIANSPKIDKADK